MSYVVVGCDVNAGNDHEVQDTVCRALEKNGHEVEKLDIAPGPFSSYDWGESGYNPSGKIGVYIIADGIYSIADRYANNGGFKYVYFIIRGDLEDRPRMRTRNDFETRPIGADPDCSGVCEKLRGKSFKEMNEIVKDKCLILFGENAEEMANELIKAMGGEVDDGSSKKKNAESTGSTIKEALKSAVKKWDGEVEINLRNDTVYVNRIKDPTTTKLVISEYDNIVYDSITATDVHPETINTLKLNFNDYELKMTDDMLVKRFGAIKKTIKAPKEVKKLKAAKAYLNREWNKLRMANGRQVELKVPGDMKWQTGVWARTYIPSLFIDDYMYITKISHEEDGTSNWLTNLTLVDYPPSFVSTDTEEESEENSDKKEEKTENESTTESSGTS